MNIIQKPNLFIVGDIHGMYDEFNKLLENFDPSDTTLVLIGDLLDRGIQSKQVLERVYSIMNDDEVSSVFVRGNHEQMLIDFIEYPTQIYRNFIENGGDKTLISLLGEDFITKNKRPVEIANKLVETYPEYINMIKESVLYFQRNNVLCVHAGVNPTLKDFKMTSQTDLMWLREEFTSSERVWQYLDPEDELEKTLKIVHGHTPVLNAPKLYYNRINVDGGCFKGGCLVGVLLDHYGDLTNIYKVNYQYHLTSPTF